MSEDKLIDENLADYKHVNSAIDDFQFNGSGSDYVLAVDQNDFTTQKISLNIDSTQQYGYPFTIEDMGFIINTKSNKLFKHFGKTEIKTNSGYIILAFDGVDSLIIMNDNVDYIMMKTKEEFMAMEWNDIEQ